MYDGSRLEYAPVSAPDLGDRSVGFRTTTSDGATVQQNFVLVGPTPVAAGRVSVDGDEVVDVVEAQVANDEAAARP